jgi:hypothetical protein
MRLAVVGSRGFNNYELLKLKLDSLHSRRPISLIQIGQSMEKVLGIEEMLISLNLLMQLLHFGMKFPQEHIVV